MKGLRREKIEERETQFSFFEQKFSREQGEAQVKSIFALILSQSVKIEQIDTVGRGFSMC